jgi:cbb3-type cytochrome oxidase subunit 3
MEMGTVLLALLVVLVVWWLGFFKSGRRLANMANRSVADLEMDQATTLGDRWKDDDVSKAKSAMERLDSL